MSLQEVVVSWLAAQSFHDKTCPVATLLPQAAGLSRLAAVSVVACSCDTACGLPEILTGFGRDPVRIWIGSACSFAAIRVRIVIETSKDRDEIQ